MDIITISITELVAFSVAIGSTIILLFKLGFIKNPIISKKQVEPCIDHTQMLDNLRAMEKILDKQIMIGKMHDRRITSLESFEEKRRKEERDIRDRLISVENSIGK
jgi:low affinity Fe/Cu permease